uniref:BCL2 interacting protein 3 n=1 Tax=Paramormyrops kingsleyae TaxID=1676925 RepID=A0A3B3TF41_9TELE
MSTEKQSIPEANLQGSWVELHFSNGGGQGEEQVSASVHSGDMEKMLLDAQHESGRSSSRGSLPCDRCRAPGHGHGHRAAASEEDYLERRQEVETIMKKNADWIWDWSSRPENMPPKEFLFRHPKRSGTLSMRNTRVMKKGGIFSAEFLKVFLPSLLISHILALGLGVYIGRRLTSPTSML